MRSYIKVVIAIDLRACMRWSGWEKTAGLSFNAKGGVRHREDKNERRYFPTGQPIIMYEHCLNHVIIINVL